MTKILVVDDDYSVRLGLRYLLSSSGYSVDLARNAVEAQQLLIGGHYSLALVDLRMPDETGAVDEDAGIKLLRHAAEHYPELPAVVLSVRDDPEASQACQQLPNARAYLVKPPDPDRLLQTVHSLLQTGSLRS